MENNQKSAVRFVVLPLLVYAQKRLAGKQTG